MIWLRSDKTQWKTQPNKPFQSNIDNSLLWFLLFLSSISISTAQKRTTIMCCVIHLNNNSNTRPNKSRNNTLPVQGSESSLLCTTSYLASDHLGTLPHQRAQFSALVSKSFFRNSFSAFQVPLDTKADQCGKYIFRKLCSRELFR